MFEKAYRISVVLLLALILAFQVFAQLNTPKPSEDCLAAIEDAILTADFSQEQLDGAVASYEKEVYQRADNINQQIFLSNEHIFMNQTNAGFVEQALLRMQIACR